MLTTPFKIDLIIVNLLILLKEEMYALGEAAMREKCSFLDALASLDFKL